MTESQKWMTFGGVLLFTALIFVLSPVITPFATAAILAYLTDPMVNRLQHWKLPRICAVIVVFLFILLLVFLLLVFLLPLLEQQIVVLIGKIPEIINWIQSIALPWFNEHFNVTWEFNMETLQKTITQNWESAGSFIGNVTGAITHSGMAIIGFATNLILIPVVLFYLLRDWDSFLAGIQKLLPRRAEPTVTKLFSECDEVLSAFLRGQLMVMIGLGILYSLGLWIVGLELALLIGMIAGLVSIVPYLGFIVGFTAATIAAFFQFHDFAHIIYVLIVFLAAQSIEGMVLTPLFVGDKIGLHPVAVIFAILAGGQLFGFVGILLALPIAAVVMVFVRFFCDRYISSSLYRQEQVEVSGNGGE